MCHDGLRKRLQNLRPLRSYIAAGENTLILSPTGSGKTLAAFLYAIDSVIRAENDSNESLEGVHTLYLSPLKALANDIERNLEKPLLSIQACAEQMGYPIPEIRVGQGTLVARPYMRGCF